MMKNEEGSIRFRLSETNGASIGGETLKPGSRSLLETVERFVEATHIVRVASIDKTGRLLAIDDLVKVAMKEGIFDIELMNRPGRV